MKKRAKSLVCLLMAMTLLLGACSGGSPGLNLPGKSDEPELELLSFDRDVISYEDEYIQQHLDFLEGEVYEEVCSYPGGLPAAIANNYKDAKLNYVNGFWGWDGFNKTVDIVLQGKIELINEYEVLVAELMQCTGSDEMFANSFQMEYLNSVVDMLGNINAQLKDAKGQVGYFTGDSIKKVEDLTQKLDAFIAAISKKQGMKEKDYKPLFSDAMKSVKETFDSDYIKENEDFVARVKTYLGAYISITEFTSEGLSGMLEEAVFFRAVERASEQWESVWADIADDARDGDDTGKKIALCIDKLLAEIRSYRVNSALVIYASAAESFGKTSIEAAYAKGQSMAIQAMSKSCMFKAIRDGTLAGVSTANALFNCDDISHFGQMLLGYGAISKYAHSAMEKTGSRLERNKDYDSALLFDEAFHIYKAIQIAAADCAINYCQAIVENPVGYVFKYTINDEIAETVMMLAHKANWIGYNCHGAMKVINNGGHAIGYMGDVYYIRYCDGHYARDGIFGSYGHDYDRKHELIRRSSDGTETVVTKTSPGPIYICNNNIVFRTDYSSWAYLPLDELGSEQALAGDIVSDYMEGRALVCYESDSKNYYITDLAGNSRSLLNRSNYISNFSVVDNVFAYYDSELESLCFFTYDLAEEKQVNCGKMNFPSNSDQGMATVIESIVHDGDKLYVLVTHVGGTGMFIQDGSLFEVNISEGKVRSLISEEISADYLRISKEDDKTYLYFDYCGNAMMGRGLYQGCCYGEVYKYDVQTGRGSYVSQQLCDMDLPFTYNGDILVFNDTSGEPLTLVSGATAAKLGYPTLGGTEGQVYYAKTVDVVDGKCYVTLVDAETDHDNDFGWRTCYVWNKMGYYVVDIESGESEELFMFTPATE